MEFGTIRGKISVTIFLCSLEIASKYRIQVSLWNSFNVFSCRVTDSAKKTVQGITYVSCERIFDSRLLMYYKILYFTPFCFFWHLLGLNWPIIRGTVSIWSMFQNRQIALIEGKYLRFWKSSGCLNTHCAANN